MGWKARGGVAALILLGTAGGAHACGAGELALPGTAACVRLGGVARGSRGGGGPPPSCRPRRTAGGGAPRRR